METDTQSSNGQPPESRRSPPDWLIVLLLAIVSIGMIGSIYLLARDKPSSDSDNPAALAVPVISRDEACTNFAEYWISQSGVNIDARVVEGLTNCWQAADGTWFVPLDSSDDRLPQGLALSENERATTEETRRELLAEIAELERSLSNSIRIDLENIYDPNLKAISGNVKEPTAITRPRSRYTRVAQAFLLAPEHSQLANYVSWLMSAKISAYEALRNECVTDSATEYLRTVCRGLEDTLSVWYPPWIWDLRDSVSLDAYLAHLVRQT